MKFYGCESEDMAEEVTAFYKEGQPSYQWPCVNNDAQMQWS
jgi:hypothetical protein